MSTSFLNYDEQSYKLIIFQKNIEIIKNEQRRRKRERYYIKNNIATGFAPKFPHVISLHIASYLRLPLSIPKSTIEKNRRLIYPTSCPCSNCN